MNTTVKQLITTLSLGASLSLLPAIWANAASITITNPGFENGWTGWTRSASGTASSDVFYTGSKSAKISSAAGTLTQTIALTPKTNYVLSAYIRGTGTLKAKVGFINYTKTGGGSSWEKTTISFNSGPASSVTITAAYNGAEGRIDEFTLDSVEIGTSSLAASSTGLSSSAPASSSPVVVSSTGVSSSPALSSNSATSSNPAVVSSLSSSSTSGAVYPADIGGGLALWKLTLPTNTTGSATSAQEIKQPALATYSSAYFALNDTKTAMVLTDLFGGSRTSSGTAYARSELREMTATNTSAAWSCTDTVRKMTLRQRITKTPTHKPEMSVGQIHDSKNDNLEIRYIGPKNSSSIGTGDGLTDTGKIEAHWNNDTSSDVLDSAYKVGDMMQIVISTDGSGYQTVAYTNERTGVTTSKTTAFSGVIGSCYFKAGNYHQACTVTDIYGNTNDSCAAKGWAADRYETDPWGTSVLEIYNLSLD